MFFATSLYQQKKDYVWVETYDAAQQMLMCVTGAEYYEIIPDGKVRLFLDADITSEDNTDNFAECLCDFKQFLKERLEAEEEAERIDDYSPQSYLVSSCVLSAHRQITFLKKQQKRSYHVHFYNLYMRKVEHLKELVEEFKKEYPAYYYLDTCVYAPFRKFRCVNQTKKGDPATILDFDDLSDTSNIKHTLITYDEIEHIAAEIPRKKPVLQIIRNMYAHANVMASSDSDSDDEVILPTVLSSDNSPNPLITGNILGQIWDMNCNAIKMSELHKKGILSFDMYTSLTTMYKIKKGEFEKNGVKWPDDPTFQLKKHNVPVLFHQFQCETGCGHQNHYKKHGEAGSDCVAFYFYPVDLSARIRCYACSCINYFHVNTRFDQQVSEGKGKELLLCDIGMNASTNIERLKTALDMRCGLHYIIEDKGVLCEFDDTSKVYEEVCLNSQRQKLLVCNKLLREILKSYYVLYANCGDMLALKQLVSSTDCVKENQFDGYLTKIYYKCLQVPHFYEERIGSVNKNVNDPGILARETALSFPIANGKKVDFKTGKITTRTAEDLFLITTCVHPCDLEKERVENFFKSLLIPESGNDEFKTQWNYFQNLIGYLMTGQTNERCVVICLGEGRNGKSVFNEVVKSVMGPYAGQLPAAFIRQEKSSTQEGHSTTLLTTKMHRISFVSELDHGEIMDCSKIKGISGGDEQRARAAHSAKVRSFTPTTTLVISSNYHPDFGNDEAVDDRVLYMAFNRRFCDPSETITNDVSKKHADPELISFLLQNRGSVLSVMLDFAKLYLRNLEISKKSAILRDMCPQSFKDIRSENKPYNLESLVLDYLEPTLDNSVIDTSITCETFNAVIFKISNELEKKGNRSANYNRLSTEAKRIKITVKDGDVRGFKEKVKKVRKEKDENGNTTRNSKQFTKWFLVGWQLKNEAEIDFEDKVLQSADYKRWIDNVVELRKRKAEGFFGNEQKRRIVEHISHDNDILI